MMDVATLIEQYWMWLRDNTHVRPIDSWYEITTPYLDRHNDGYTISDLEMSGCAVDTPKRKQLLDTTVNGFGVRLEGKALTTSATADQFPLQKHSLVQAILAVNDLFFVASPASTMYSTLLFRYWPMRFHVDDLFYAAAVTFERCR